MQKHPSHSLYRKMAFAVLTVASACAGKTVATVSPDDNVVTPTFGISIEVNGLLENTSVSVSDGSTTVDASTGITAMGTSHKEGSSYSLAIVNPAGQVCTSDLLSGVMPAQDLLVSILCTLAAYPVTFQATGLAGNDTVSVANDRGNYLPLSAAVPTASWADLVPYGAPVLASLSRFSPHVNCVFDNGSTNLSTTAPANPMSVAVHCNRNYSLYGTVSGLYPEGYLSLVVDGRPINVNGNQTTFNTEPTLANNANWSLAITAQPLNQICSVESPQGIVANANITGVEITCIPHLIFSFNQDAGIVIGQPDFFTGDPGPGNTNNAWATPLLGAPFVTEDQSVLIADTANARILVYDYFPSTNGAGASSIWPDTIGGAVSMASDGNHFAYVYTDSSVAIYNTALPVASTADTWIGSDTSCSQTGIVEAAHVWMSNGAMSVADIAGNRVLIYHSTPTTFNQAADVVLGQADFNSCGNSNIDATTTREPFDSWFNDDMVIASSALDNRTLIWKTGIRSVVNGQPADIVLGAPDKVTPGTALPTRTSFQPGNSISNGQQLFINDENNNRILVWNSIPTVDNQPPDGLLGQPNWTSSDCSTPPTKSSMCVVHGIALMHNALLVSDTSFYRILAFEGTGSP